MIDLFKSDHLVSELGEEGELFLHSHFDLFVFELKLFTFDDLVVLVQNIRALRGDFSQGQGQLVEVSFSNLRKGLLVF